MLGNVDPHKVKVSPWIPAVYRGRDNFVAAQFTQWNDTGRRDSPLDWSEVTRLILVLPEVDLSFDTAVAPDCMDWTSHAAGVVEFKLSQYAVTQGVYRAQLIAFDDQHPNGQVIVSSLETQNEFTLTINEVLTSGRLPAPLPTGGEAAVRIAGETISALRVVYERNGRVYLLDPTDPFSEDVQFMLGITVTAADAGGTVAVQRSGTIDSDGWNWAEGLLFVAPAGMLTQIPPVVGWELVVGTSPSPTRLNLDFDEPVRLQ